MDCDALNDLLPLYALGTLDGAEEEQVRRHLQTGCPRCLGKLAEFQAIVALLPLSVPPIAPPPAIRDRLLKQITQSSSSPASPVSGMKIVPAEVPPPPVRKTHWIIPAMLGGALAAGVTALVFSQIVATQKSSIEQLHSQLAMKNDEVGRLQESVHEAQEINHFVKAPSVQVVNLQGTDKQPSAKARLFWNPSSRALRFYAADLKNLPPGEAFELWFVNADQQKIPAGVFMADAHGDGILSATLSANPGKIVAVAVTNEPSVGVPAPTGVFQFLKTLD